MSMEHQLTASTLSHRAVLSHSLLSCCPKLLFPLVVSAIPSALCTVLVCFSLK